MYQSFPCPIWSADEQVGITSRPEITVGKLFAFKSDLDHHFVPRSGERHFSRYAVFSPPVQLCFLLASCFCAVGLRCCTGMGLLHL